MQPVSARAKGACDAEELLRVMWMLRAVMWLLRAVMWLLRAVRWMLRAVVWMLSLRRRRALVCDGCFALVQMWGAVDNSL
eukprot:8422110-Pyramimonas_sp.AAC.1